MGAISEYFKSFTPEARQERNFWKQQARRLQVTLSEAHERLEEVGAAQLFAQSVMPDLLVAEDEGWDLISGGDSNGNRPGPTWTYLARNADQIRGLLSQNSHMHRGAELIADYTWSASNVTIGNIERKSGSKRGRISSEERVWDILDLPRVQRYVFSNVARRERTIARFSDGWIGVLWDDKTSEPQRIPVWEITGDYSNPDNAEEIWAYRREWTTKLANGEVKTNRMWYFTDLAQDKRVKSIDIGNGTREPVDMGKTLIDDVSDGQVGWALGVAYANTAISAVKLYAHFLNNGFTVTEAMAKYVYKLSMPTKKGAEQAAFRTSTNGGSAGQTAAIAGGDMSVLSSAGRGYDFCSGIGIAAVIASAIGVSAVALLSDSSAAGSSYGAASTLDLPTKLATIRKQNVEADYEQRTLRYLGAKNPKVEFSPIVDPAEQYREIQAANIAYQTGVFHADELRPFIASKLGIELLHDKVPTGALLPQNEKSLPLKSIDTDASSAASSLATSTGDNQSTNATDPAFDNPTTAGATGNSPRD
mgnify:CR=1 FL=1